VMGVPFTNKCGDHELGFHAVTHLHGVSFQSTTTNSSEICSWMSRSTSDNRGHSVESFGDDEDLEFCTTDDSDVESSEDSNVKEATAVPFPTRSMCHQDLPLCFVSDVVELTKTDSSETCSWMSRSTSSNRDCHVAVWCEDFTDDEDVEFCNTDDSDVESSEDPDLDVKAHEATVVPFPTRSMCHQDLPLCFDSDAESCGEISDDGLESQISVSCNRQFPMRSLCVELPLIL